MIKPTTSGVSLCSKYIYFDTERMKRHDPKYFCTFYFLLRLLTQFWPHRFQSELSPLVPRWSRLCQHHNILQRSRCHHAADLAPIYCEHFASVIRIYSQYHCQNIQGVPQLSSHSVLLVFSASYDHTVVHFTIFQQPRRRQFQNSPYFPPYFKN